MAGLLDQHTNAGDTRALKMVTRMADYFYNRVQNVITKYTISRHYQSLNEKTGGMNDVLYNLYTITAFNTTQNNMLILQESCVDSSGSLVVYCPVDLPMINVAMSGEDPSSIPLLPSGFTVVPDGQVQVGGGVGGDGASSSSSMGRRPGGSLITVAFQILVSSLPSAKLNLESVTTVNNLIGTTVHQIKAALNCPTAS